MARQLRKVYGAIKAIDAFVKARKSDFLIGDELSVADIAAGAMLGMMDMVETQVWAHQVEGGVSGAAGVVGAVWRSGRVSGRRGRSCLS